MRVVGRDKAEDNINNNIVRLLSPDPGKSPLTLCNLIHSHKYQVNCPPPLSLSSAHCLSGTHLQLSDYYYYHYYPIITYGSVMDSHDFVDDEAVRLENGGEISHREDAH